jgi:hypothetical protein
MQRDFNNRDFEQFVKQNADQYRMFPSEKVWQGIDNALHTRRRWYGFGFALLLLLTGTAVTLVMVSNSENKQPKKSIASLTPPKEEKASDILIEKNTKPAPALLVSNTVTPVTFAVPLLTQPGSVFPSETANAEKIIEPTLTETNSGIVSTAAKATLGELPVTNSVQKRSNPVATQLTNKTNIVSSGSPLFITPNNTVITTDVPKQRTEEGLSQPNTQSDIYPLTIESVLNSYQPFVKGKKFTMQFYIAPNISYRKLSKNDKFLETAAGNGTIPVYAAYSDINNFVSHKPDMGLELGFTGKYALTQSLKLRAGVQFNVSRYDIKAAYDEQRESATIALDGGNFGANQSITRQTNYRNASGNNANWLKNLYYSVSLPIGAELTFKSKDNTHFGIAASIQPTYIIKDRAYLITTDYKNYVEVPSLVRKVNMNTSFEAFVAYSTGNINWQIGPQVRYQLQSSFKAKYPFKENLFDFGLKVGIQLNR